MPVVDQEVFEGSSESANLINFRDVMATFHHSLLDPGTRYFYGGCPKIENGYLVLLLPEIMEQVQVTSPGKGGLKSKIHPAPGKIFYQFQHDSASTDRCRLWRKWG